MAKFYIGYKITQWGETTVEADTLEDAREIAEDANTKASAEWGFLEDVSDAEVMEVTDVTDDDDFHL